MIGLLETEYESLENIEKRALELDLDSVSI